LKDFTLSLDDKIIIHYGFGFRKMEASFEVKKKNAVLMKKKGSALP